MIVIVLSRERAEKIALTYCEREFDQAKASNHCMILAQDDQPADQEFTLVGGREGFEVDSEDERDEKGDWKVDSGSDMEVSSLDDSTEEQDLFLITPSSSSQGKYYLYYYTVISI